jgi:uncharacterized damage-inducible protein DinB
MMTLEVVELMRSMAQRTRIWRERAINGYQELHGDNLGYRPASGMSSFGWLLAHQAAVYDYSLNVLIKGGTPKNPELFRTHVPGTDGEWTGVSLQEIEDYYSASEKDILAFVNDATDEQLISVPEHEMPAPFRGMRVIDLIANSFVHLSHHNGHLNTIVQELEKAKK